MTFQDILTLITQHGVKALLMAVSSLLTWGYGRLSRRIRQEQREGRAGRDATRALLADRMVEQYNRHMEKGFFPIHARQNVEDMYTAYKALGGNGTIEDLYKRLCALPTERKEEPL